jgi:hypothetical protein
MAAAVTEQEVEELLAAEIPSEQLALIQPLPDLKNEASTMEWLRRLMPLMDARSPYRRRLGRAIARYDFRNERKNKK